MIDSLRSTTAVHANVVLAELPFFAKDGTLTTGDRRITRQRSAAQPRRDERDGVAILVALANALGGDFAYESAGEVMAEAAASLEGYEPYDAVRSGRTRALSSSPASGASPQALPASSDGAAADGLRLIADRSLYTSWEGASLRSEQADKLHREESLLINPADAEPLGVRGGDELVLANGSHEVRIPAQLDDGVPPGVVYASRYFDGGALMALFPLRGAADAAAEVRVRALQPA